VSTEAVTRPRTPARREFRPLQRLRAAAVSDVGARVTAYICGLIGWEILARAYDRVPGPVEVVRFLADEFERGVVWDNFAVTAERFFAGLGLALVAGVLLGLVMGMAPIARALLKDTLTVGLAIPAIIWAFLTALWFGFSWKAPVLTVAFSATPFVAINVLQGVQGTPRDLTRMA
jgi:ABC-type nitrate/sulfonate/bicarbonate transport system permease component